MTWFRCENGERVGNDRDLAADIYRRKFISEELGDEFEDWILGRYEPLELVKTSVGLGKDAVTYLLTEFICEKMGADENFEEYGYIWKKEE